MVVWQETWAQYTASGNSITFATPPAVDSNVFIIWIFGGISRVANRVQTIPDIILLYNDLLRN